jgi:hypothetical protein
VIDQKVSGRMLAFPDADPPVPKLGVADAEAPSVVARVKNVIARAKESIATLTGLRQRLSGNGGEVGVVYVLCHALWRKPSNESLLSSLLGPADQIRFGDLLTDPDGILAGGKSIVFINACASGAAQGVDEFLPDPELVGFAKPFLNRGAQAVIGTLAKVHIIEATRFAQELFDAVAANPGVPLAELLRRARADATARLAQQPDDEVAMRWWFYTFHYVMYGNPRVCVELA